MLAASSSVTAPMETLSPSMLMLSGNAAPSNARASSRRIASRVSKARVESAATDDNMSAMSSPANFADNKVKVEPPVSGVITGMAFCKSSAVNALASAIKRSKLPASADSQGSGAADSSYGIKCTRAETVTAPTKFNGSEYSPKT